MRLRTAPHSFSIDLLGFTGTHADVCAAAAAGSERPMEWEQSNGITTAQDSTVIECLIATVAATEFGLVSRL